MLSGVWRNRMPNEHSYVPPMMISGFGGEIGPVSGERLVYFGDYATFFL